MNNNNNSHSVFSRIYTALDSTSLLLILILIAIAMTGLLADRSYNVRSTESIQRVVAAGELEQLEKYSSLSYLDLSGSTCYDEILAYSENHPDIDVRYTVTIGETAVSNTETELNWSGKDTRELLSFNPSYLPALEKIALGTVSPAELDAVREHFPDAELFYSVMLAGNAVSCDESFADLSLNTFDAAETAELLKYLPNVKEIKLGSVPFEDYRQLFDSRSDICYDYSFELFGKTVSTADEALSYKKVSIGDDGLDTLRGILPYLPKLTYLSLDRCDTSDSAAEALNLDFPDKKIVWRIFFHGFSCMTDTEKIWAIGALYDEDCIPLQYCHDVKYLDLGHNAIKSVDFVKGMPKLEVLIICTGTTEDIKALEGCKNLEYLELNETRISDLTPLAGCTALRHLEISLNPAITDITPLYGLDLERFYSLYNNTVPKAQYDEFSALHPDCDVNHGCGKYLMCPLVESHWRYEGSGYSARYALLREQIGYDDPYGASRLYPKDN